jgi:DNA modification methylase
MDCNDFYLGDGEIDLIITDPPYDGFVNMDKLRRLCNGTIIMFCAQQKPFFKPEYLAYWEKPSAPKNTIKKLGQTNIEWILIETSQWSKYNGNLFWSNYTGIFHDELINKPIHPFEKPESLIERLIKIYSNPGDMVFDPYSGSGTTAVVCKKTGRGFYGCEIDKTYFDLSVSRLKEVK